MKEPARNAELPGKDAVTVPVAPRSVLEQRQTTEPNPIEQLTIPAKSLAAAIDSLPGVIEMPPGSSAVSRGSGSDGACGEVTVVRSLDSVFGLDLEAIKAARQWRFKPGTRLGEPVSVPVTIELDFVLR